MTVIAGFAAFVWRSGWLIGGYPDEIRPVLTTMQFNPAADNVFRCWMPEPAGFEKYPADCGTGDTLVWGDSQAGRLYAGLKRDGVEIGEFVRDGCPPVLNIGVETCMESNAAILRKIAELRPKKVILFGLWAHYTGHGLSDKPDGGLAETLRELKRIGIDVVVIGQTPIWVPDLPTQVYNFWNWNGYLPDRLLLAKQEVVDGMLSRASSVAGVRFVSAFEALCNERGCLTHTPASRSELPDVG